MLKRQNLEIWDLIRPMIDNKANPPECFGQLDTVFPVSEGGLRTSPPECMRCPHAKSCLQAAMRSPEGLKLLEEKVDQAYQYGLIGKLSRWSRKKLIHNQMEDLTSKAKSKHKGKGKRPS